MYHLVLLIGNIFEKLNIYFAGVLGPLVEGKSCSKEMLSVLVVNLVPRVLRILPNN